MILIIKIKINVGGKVSISIIKFIILLIIVEIILKNFLILLFKNVIKWLI